MSGLPIAIIAAAAAISTFVTVYKATFENRLNSYITAAMLALVIVTDVSPRATIALAATRSVVDIGAQTVTVHV